MIIDCCLLFNELDMLELRLEELSPVVDFFVVVESTKTFQGAEKPPFLSDNLSRFSRFGERMAVIVVDEEPLPEAGWERCWTREHNQRNAILRGLLGAFADDDIVLVSDVDEIPSRAAVREVIARREELRKQPIFFLQQLRYYFLDCAPALPKWDCSYAARLDFVRKVGPQAIRIDYRDSCRKGLDGRGFASGGWHLSYFGGAVAVSDKLRSFSHVEYNRPDLTDVDGISVRISSLTDPCGRGYQILRADAHDLPEYVLENREKYERMGWFRP